MNALRRAVPLFLLLSCGPDIESLPGDCKQVTCASIGATCGAPDNGCGVALQCGECAGANTCGGAGQPFVCGVPGGELVPPPIEGSTPTDFGSAFEFLYTGPTAVQTGVAPGTIQARRVVVVRGVVRGRAGEPIQGARVTVLNHPELGQTLTRADGHFDLAANGGGPLTLDVAREGHLSVQRQVDVPWREFDVVDDIVLTPLDPAVTTVASDAAEYQVVQSTPSADTAGRRRATLLVAPGTHATMRLPDGTSRAVGTLAIRGTEYTVGTTGPRAMPGTLPPTSGYTYAVEWSLDEAVAAGATQVDFNRPVAFYLENYLGFPVGSAVPAGYYDRGSGEWKADDNGRVVKVLAVSNGLAVLDTDGDGAADSGAQLETLGASEGERRKLAELYAPGVTLWRVPLKHFTPWDCNWPYGPPDDAEYPEEEPEDEGILDRVCKLFGSDIGCENQSLGQAVALHGTPFTLHYQSERTLGRRTGSSLHIPVTGASVPASLQAARVTLEVAGQVIRRELPPRPNQSFDFEWDGKDAYGRPLNGAQKVLVRISYEYPLEYKTPAAFTQSFARIAQGDVAGGSPEGFFLQPVRRGDASMSLAREWRGTVGTWRPSAQLGGWTLSVHHTYDPLSRTLYLGNGERLGVQELPRVVERILGGSDARGIALRGPRGLLVAPDGVLYVADNENHRILRRSVDGSVSVFAGSGRAGDSGDGGSALEARFEWITSMVAMTDGSILVSDQWAARVRRIRSDGIIETFAGTGVKGFSGDEGPATLARLSDPLGMALAPDGSLYIADVSNNRIRRVGPDGKISTVAGVGTAGFSGDGGLATAARLNRPYSVVLSRDGAILVADTQNGRIRRVTPDGIITTIAGTGERASTGDGGPAISAAIHTPEVIFEGRDGSIYVASPLDQRVRRIDPSGTIRTFAGGGPATSTRDVVDGTPVDQANLNGPGPITVAPDGDVYVAEIGDSTVLRLRTPLPGAEGAAARVPSPDGAFIYDFDVHGRHLRTLDALTLNVVLSFGYDAAGRLTSLTDLSGLVTRIERDTAGNPVELVAPHGQRTTFALDDAGYLSSVTDPVGRTLRLTHSPLGLLERIEEPGGAVHAFRYDSEGRLISDQGPNGALTLARTEMSGGFEVQATTAMGRVSRHRVQTALNGTQLRTFFAPDGTQTTTQIDREGRRLISAPDGMVTLEQESADVRSGIRGSLSSKRTQTPGGRVRVEEVTQSATRPPEAGPLEVSTLTTQVAVNGQRWTSVWDAERRTVVSRSPMGRDETRFLDEKGRFVRHESPGVLASDYGYDAEGRLVSVTRGTRRETLGYDAQGNLATLTDSLGRITSLTRDPIGRITRIVRPGNRTTELGYDLASNLTSVTAPGRSTGHLFTPTVDGLDGVEQPPAVAGASGAYRYTYDRDRHLSRVDLPDGASVSSNEDATTGRLRSLVTDRTTITPQFDGVGRLQALVDPAGASLSFTYDGSLVTGVTWSGAVSGTVQYTFDDFLRVSAVSVGAATAAYRYDNDGDITQAGELTLSRAAATGFLQSTRLDAVVTSYSYDPFGDLASLSGRAGSTALFSSTLTRDAGGRISRQVETVQGTTRTLDYTYDEAGRLAQVAVNGAAVARYQYDAQGNRVLSDEDGRGRTATFDAQDRLLTDGDASFGWTPKGELASRTQNGAVTRFDYDAVGALTDVTLADGTAVEYLIDASGRRVGKRINGEVVQRFLYDGPLRVVAELDGSGALISRFVYGGRSHVPDYMVRNGVSYRILSDAAGSPRLVVHAGNGAVAQRIDYDAWGRIVGDTNPGFQPFGFAGGLYDRHTGLTRFGERDYDPQAGRWTSRDPLGFGAGDTNLYAYVYGDPVNLVDPSGRNPVLVALVALGGLDFICSLYNGNYGRAAFNAALLGSGGVLRALQLAERLGASVWGMDKFARGFAIERALGGHLPAGFRTIDKFVNGVATSIKSVDLGADTYQNASRLRSLLKGYVDRVAEFTGAARSTYAVDRSEITQRVLEVAIPRGGGTAAQQAAMQSIVQYGESVGVVVKIVPFP